ncbi:MAG TPA: hypothetical protein VE377_08220 [Candidatus Dormibacteraeota bacterium]|nr:hypothetical protein [Candidatus Dormibacteraeota bacterium]
MFPGVLPAVVPVLPVVAVPVFPPMVPGLDTVLFEGRVVVVAGRVAVFEGRDVDGGVRLAGGCCAGALT